MPKLSGQPTSRYVDAPTTDITFLKITIMAFLYFLYYKFSFGVYNCVICFLKTNLINKLGAYLAQEISAFLAPLFNFHLKTRNQLQFGKYKEIN